MCNTNDSLRLYLVRQLKGIIELRNNSEKLSNINIRVSKDIYDKAEKMAKDLNTNVEGDIRHYRVQAHRNEDRLFHA